jgi:inorganic pyrophosphatase/exopolyphosphatase
MAGGRAWYNTHIMRIVTSGAAYIDIDAFAGCVAYAELLKLQGFSAYAISTSPWSASITPTVRSWGAPLLSKYKPSFGDTFTLIDISDPAHFDAIVNLKNVNEIIDHHPGFEQYWFERLGERARIEFIGAACTLVYEQWLAAERVGRMNPVTARLLITGILDNTLNFGAHVTDNRDREAYATLMTRADLPTDWPARYFTECQQAIMADVPKALRNDTKRMEFAGLPGQTVVGQLALWDGPAVLQTQLTAIRGTMQALQHQWFTNLISIGDGASYFIADDPVVQAWLTKLLSLKFDNGVARANRLWLRKEIIKQSLS